MPGKPDFREFSAVSRATATQLPRLLAHHAELLPAPDQHDAFGPLFDRFAAARIILLGEATHGTSEFYRARSAITRRLIERHGFTIVAVEADWFDAALVDRYVRHREPAQNAAPAFQRFPIWMWRNVEVARFLDWLRRHNEALPPGRRVAFRGLDVYSLGGSIEAVISYLDRVDPDAGAIARRRYGCLTPWQSEPAEYGRAVIYGEKDPCETEVVAQLKDLLAQRMPEIGDDDEALFDATQNARIVRAAERYYRLMYRGSRESWNLRDRHMFDTLQTLLKTAGEGVKAVVWAHNSHIGNAAATAMGWQGEFNIGELCRTAYRDDATLIGFGADRGTVAAADDWGGEMKVKTVLPARPDSYEHAFRRAGGMRPLTEWRDPRRRELAEALRDPFWSGRSASYTDRKASS